MDPLSDVFRLSYSVLFRAELAAPWFFAIPHAREMIAEAAARVGYQSEAAFHRAFKRLIGEPPAAWRRRVGHPLAAAAS